LLEEGEEVGMNRRDLFKALGFGAGAAILAPRLLKAKPKVEAPLPNEMLALRTEGQTVHNGDVYFNGRMFVLVDGRWVLVNG
jgi:hypothetical protein